MLFFFFVTICCFSFILLLNSREMRNLLSIWFLKDFSNSIKISFTALSSSSSRMLLKNKEHEGIDGHSKQAMSVLDLPELALESVLERLEPEALCAMATVCSSLRDMCASDRLWERHVRSKWGKVIGACAYEQWKHCGRKGSIFVDQIDHHHRHSRKGLMGFVSHHLWRFGLVGSGFIAGDSCRKRDPNPDFSVVSFYVALESGEFWFPAQVYNRENGHVGFMLSCYDAELSYDRKTDTFQARYPPHGRRTSPVERCVTWDRIRSSPVETSWLDLHASDCLNGLRPGDQIEIQWRRNKGLPYGWWYGVVGHLETCEGNENHCQCHHSETIVLEFKQYTRGSRWRTTTVNRRGHREEGNGADGLYGGIRKIHCDEEKSTWRKLWPVEMLE